MNQKSRSFFLILGLCSLFVAPVCAQIGAEAQGGKLTAWVALGIDQELSQRWTSVTDIGYGRHSDPDNSAFVERLGLNVLTQDFVCKIGTNWSLLLGGGYWRRQAYTDEAPYDHRPAPYEYRNELRPYQRIFYRQHLRRIKISHSLRTDIRFYYTEDMQDRWTTPFEFRLRYMESWSIPLSRNNAHKMILVDELLTAVDRYGTAAAEASGKKWSPYQFTENRFSLYYRHSVNMFDFDFGIMHQYWREKPGVPTFNVSYNLMFDLIVHDPFSRHLKKEA
jgi:hypothetical protein